MTCRSFGPRIPAETLERLWTMLAHNQGTLLNASRLAFGLSVSVPTVTGYIGLPADLFLVRRLSPHHANVGKRLVNSPKTYVRDSLNQHLRRIDTMPQLYFTRRPKEPTLGMAARPVEAPSRAAIGQRATHNPSHSVKIRLT